MTVKLSNAPRIGARAYDRGVEVGNSDPLGARQIGPHLPLAAGLLKAADRAHAIGATAVQIWTDNPTAWRRRTDQPKALAEFRDRLRAGGVKSISVHAPYLINLCGADEVFWQRSVETVVNELRVARRYGADFVVMHIGSHRGMGREQGISRLVAGLGVVLERLASDDDSDAPTSVRPRLLLENSSGTGDGIGAPLEDLADIFDAAATAGLATERLGICLDTAHLWGAGYDLSGQAGVDEVVTRIDDLVGREHVRAIHLNDSRTVLGSHLDRHEHIAAGELGADGMRELLTHPWLATLPTFLETPGMDTGYDAVNLDRVRMLIDGDTPPQLPPEAFEQRSSRSRTAPPDAS
jgi:deoxyribonuclease-4